MLARAIRETLRVALRLAGQHVEVADGGLVLHRGFRFARRAAQSSRVLIARLFLGVEVLLQAHALLVQAGLANVLGEALKPLLRFLLRHEHHVAFLGLQLPRHALRIHIFLPTVRLRLNAGLRVAAHHLIQDLLMRLQLRFGLFTWHELYCRCHLGGCEILPRCICLLVALTVELWLIQLKVGQLLGLDGRLDERAARRMVSVCDGLALL